MSAISSPQENLLNSTQSKGASRWAISIVNVIRKYVSFMAFFIVYLISALT
jgi:hypothetical protein